jgi:uncharacterized protein
MLSPTLQRIILLLALAALLGIPSCAQRSQPTLPEESLNTQSETRLLLPVRNGFVNDYANVFDADSKRRLELLLVELQEKANIEFAVVTVDTTDGQPIFDYSLAVARAWKLGPKDGAKGGGLLLMLAIKDHQWHLQVSRSLEKDLPNQVCKELGDKSTGSYKQGRYAEGIGRYVKAIIDRLEEVRAFSLTRDL